MSIHASSSSSSSSSTLPSISRVNTASVAFVLSLCLPYVISASPVTYSPHKSLESTSEASSVSSSSFGPEHDGEQILTAREILKSVGNIVIRQFDPSSQTGDPPGGALQMEEPPGFRSNVSDSVQNSWWASKPQVGFIPFGHESLYHVPPNFVLLNQHFDAGFIVLSYAIAFVGSLCTLELLIRRTTNTGWKNRVLLLSAGITFGAVSTFAMHFIFNNSLSLHHPSHNNTYPSIHLAYSAGYTILSLAASCIAMTLAFFIMGTRIQLSWLGRKTEKEDVGRERKRSSDDGKLKHRGSKSEFTNDKLDAVRRSSSKIGALIERAGSVAKWSLVNPTPVKESRKGSDPARKGSADSKKAAKRASWKGSVGYGESVENIVSNSTPQLANIASFNRSTTTLDIEDTQESNDDKFPVWNSDGSNGATVFSPDFNFPPKNRSLDLDRTAPLQQHAPLGLTADVPPSPFTPIADSGTSGTPGEAPPHHNYPSPSQSLQYDLNRRSSLPDTSFQARPGYKPSKALSRIASMSEFEPGELPSPRIGIIKRESRPVPVPPPRTSSSSINRRSTSLRPTYPDAAISGKADKHKREYNKIETFLGFDVVTQTELIKILVTGSLAGFGVAGMHYIGQLSIIEIPYIAYREGYVIGSVVIACGAVCIALYIMFIMLRPKLKHTLVSKIIVAAILAVAVCGMHFCGMMGTVYGWRLHDPISKHALLTGTNRAITAIVAALAFAACIASAVFFLLNSLQSRRERARRRRVVVAAVMMDEQDRILVNSIDGMLPMCDIASLSGGMEDLSAGTVRSTRSTGGRTESSGSTLHSMDLSVGHEAFISALRISWAWREPSIVIPPNPLIREKTSPEGTAAANPGAPGPNSGETTRKNSLATTTNSALGSPRAVSLTVTKFLERFTFSTSQLAYRLIGNNDKLPQLGVLYDQILTTGWVKLNNSNDTVSKGQLIFLVRRVLSTHDQMDLLARQFIFADSNAVASAMHKTLSVPFEHTMPLLDDIRLFCDSTLQSLPQPGALYAGVAIVQATPFDGLRVMLEPSNRAQLPMREMCRISASTEASAEAFEADPEQLCGTLEQLGEAVSWLKDMNLMNVIGRNMADNQDLATGKQMGGPIVTNLLLALERAIIPMLDEIVNPEDMAHVLPRLQLNASLVPLTPCGPAGNYHTPRTNSAGSSSGGAGSGSDYIPPYIVIFYANYDAATNTFTDKWLPFNLFKTQNSCVMASTIAAAYKANTTPDLSGLPSSPEAATLRSPTTMSVNTRGQEDGYNMYARRPSKVQFELTPISPPQSATSASTSRQTTSPLPSPTSLTTLNPSLQISGSSSSPALFGEYAFPPKSPTTASETAAESSVAPLTPSTALGQSSSTPSTVNTNNISLTPFSPYYTITQSPSTSTLHGRSMSVTALSMSTPSSGPPNPRKSSLATRSRFDTHFSDIESGPSGASGSAGGGDLNSSYAGSSGMGGILRMTPKGVEAWDPEWLLLLLRHKLKAEPDAPQPV